MIRMILDDLDVESPRIGKRMTFLVYDEAHLDFWEVSALVANKLSSSEHFFQSVEDVRPKEVSDKIGKVQNGKHSCMRKILNSLFHWSAVVVDLIQDINYSPTEKDCGVVEVIHEAGKLAF